ncbi:secreted protein [Candidatus Magnetobacterium bavaricum]|uniref:Secreted protein n=1 Tax=Candidatus Magnetobacterium bavaricum TaxID=29290 RepID=A0A0F3GVB0_9BACT|nr:secreted protein [Candidatus Magnetobacterium bavaricum]
MSCRSSRYMTLTPASFMAWMYSFSVFSTRSLSNVVSSLAVAVRVCTMSSGRKLRVFLLKQNT